MYSSLFRPAMVSCSVFKSFRGRPFVLRGGWQILSSQNIYFRGFAGQKIYFQPLKGKIIYFLYTIMWNLEAKIFIVLFSRGVGQNIYFHCYRGQNIIAKSTAQIEKGKKFYFSKSIWNKKIIRQNFLESVQMHSN